MPAHSISPEALQSALAAEPDQIRSWCASLEAGEVLYFPRTPVPIPPADLDVLLGQHQTGSALHKNIAYKPVRDELTGVDAKSSPVDSVRQLHDIMRRYSASVEGFLTRFLAPYRKRWALDYASYRPIEEQGRDLPVRRRNDLLHTDAFPTRPTRGWRILRFFHNIHPTRTRDWVFGEPFPRIVGRFVRTSALAALGATEGTGFSPYITQPQKTGALAPEGTPTPHPLSLPRSDTVPLRIAKAAAYITGFSTLVPRLKRTPYDQFMIQLHNAMKEDAAFQSACVREHFQFAPGSSWMVYTETVPHAVLGGQYALEQTFLVDPAAMVTPESAPVVVLEKLSGARVV